MAKKGKVARFKIQRRLLTELPGLGKPGALERKPYPPGQHANRRIKYSDYRLQLEEKQKVRFHYGLREEQLLRLVKEAKRKNGNWMVDLINSLEKRLNNILFRAGIAPSQMSAGQMVSHGHVLVNGKKVNIRSQKLKMGDKITLSAKGLKNQIYTTTKNNMKLQFPDWLEKNETETSVEVILKHEPTMDTIPFPLEEGLVTSYYSKV